MDYIEYLDYLISNNLIAEEHIPTLRILFSDCDKSSSISEILINHQYIDEETYVKMTNDLYKNKSLDNIELVPASKLSTLSGNLLADYNLPQDKISNILTKMLNVGLMCYKVDINIKQVHFVLKEPDHRTQDIAFNQMNFADQNIDFNLIKDLCKDFTSVLNCNQYQIVIVSTHTFKELIKPYCSNFKLVMNVKYAQIPIDGKHFIRKIVADGIAQRCSDITIWGVTLGDNIKLCWGYTILGTYMKDNFLECTPAFLSQIQSEVYTWIGSDYAGCSEPKVREGDAHSLVHLPNYRGRLNLLPGKYLDSIAIRVIPDKTAVIPYSVLNLTPEIKSELRDIALMNSSGIVCIAGEVGCGKSTLLRSILKLLHEEKHQDRIESIESPIEAVLDGICQIELGEGAKIKPEDVLKALTRRSAKILNVNEINTPNMMEMAINAAVMSLLVFTTIHTESVPALPDRIKGFAKGQSYMFRQFIYNSKAYLHLTMLKRCCPNCTHTVDATHPLVTSDLVQVFKDYGYQSNYYPLTEPQEDCPICKGKGLLPLEPVICVELLNLTDNFITNLSETPDHEIRRLFKSTLMQNGRTGVHDAIRYMQNGMVDVLQIYEKFSLLNAVGANLNRDELSLEKIQALK